MNVLCVENVYDQCHNVDVFLLKANININNNNNIIIIRRSIFHCVISVCTFLCSSCVCQLLLKNFMMMMMMMNC